uniref:TIGR00297 family protein n=1 Tax=Synechococcus sp. UW106 TaxID=368495 RepID=UPI000E0F3D83|nr:TIGR00297 family protein [Synechococcus sp. UW106]
MSGLWIQALAVNTVLIALAQRTPLLTRSGWVHAAALGTILWGCLGWSGWLAVVAYLSLGTLVTKIGFQNKQSRGLAEARGGQRGPENVWGSAAVGALLALLIGAGVEPRALLMVGFAASFAAKLADTFGSEIGKRFGRTTVLISNLRPVPPGTEGAISLEGTLASAVGSIVMTLVMLALQLLQSWPLAGLVMVVGLLATLAESLLGALVQDRVAWLSNELVNALQTLLAALLAMLLMAL